MSGEPPLFVGTRDANLRDIARMLEEYPEPPTLRMVDEIPAAPTTYLFAEPEDRGTATLSDLGTVEYVEDLVRPGRIIVVAAEEGSGKSYAIDSELGIRLAVAGGSWAGTWPILRTGTAVYLSEMHPDDDFDREATVLASLGLERESLVGRYYRLSLMTAADGAPALTVAAWRADFTAWCRDHEAIVAIFDTATGATQVDPWGKAIQEVFANLRKMLEQYPALAVLLLLHLKKPSARGARRISDVLGEWGRWCDVVVMLEDDGARTKVTTRKRVRHQRRIVATKSGGLLIDPVDADGPKATKVPAADVVAHVPESPDGIALTALAGALGVTPDTAKKYVAGLAGELVMVKRAGKTGAWWVYRPSELPNAPEQARFGSDSGGEANGELPASELPNHPVGDSELARKQASPPGPDLASEARRIFEGDDGLPF